MVEGVGVTRQHSPLCDTQLGPEFEVRDGVVLMTIHACVDFECLNRQDE